MDRSVVTPGNRRQKLEEAIARHRAGRLEEARRGYREVLHQDPGDPVALQFLALLRQQEGALGEAAALLGRAAELAPQEAGIHLDLGRVALAGGDPQSARRHLEEARRLDPRSPEIRYHLASALFQGGQAVEAVEMLRTLVEAGQGGAALFRLLAEALLESGDPAGAREAIERALAIEPEDPRGLELAARMAAGKIGRESGPVPLDASELNRLGNQRLAEDDLAGAEAAFRQALDANPSLSDARINLSLVRLFRLGETERGREWPRVRPAAPFADPQRTLWFAFPSGTNYGWGLCGNHLRRHLSPRVPLFDLAYDDWEANGGKHLPGPLFACMGAENLETIFPVRGARNIGYTFFERDLTPLARENARRWDLILAGSNWATEQLAAHGIEHAATLLQGVDHLLFSPRPPRQGAGFVLFSGGKFELRKGQDLVIAAFRALQEKFPDLVLIAHWINFWPASMDTMAASPHIRYERRGETWQEQMAHILDINGIDRSRVVVCDVVEQRDLPALYANSDLGLFPNRCEGGTNLVLMEYMACGRPVIASHATGHRDSVHAGNALLLESLPEQPVKDGTGRVVAHWPEPDLDELIARIEHAYHHREALAPLAEEGVRTLQPLSWERTAREALRLIGEV